MSQSCHKWFVISPKLKRSSCTKMAKMPNCGESCQQFTVKSGVARLRVSQLVGKKSKRSPMVSRFLLHDPSDMSIGGVSGKRKLSIWGGMLEGQRHCQEVFCILDCLLCRGGPLQHPALPLRRSVKGTTLVRKWTENSFKNSPCRENVAVV
jgi:hypothetical protein